MKNMCVSVSVGVNRGRWIKIMNKVLNIENFSKHREIEFLSYSGSKRKVP